MNIKTELKTDKILELELIGLKEMKSLANKIVKKSERLNKMISKFNDLELTFKRKAVDVDTIHLKYGEDKIDKERQIEILQNLLKATQRLDYHNIFPTYEEDIKNGEELISQLTKEIEYAIESEEVFQILRSIY